MTDEKPLCFVVGPIGEPGTDARAKADWVLEAIIKPVAVALGYSVVRADEIHEPGMIDAQVINRVIDAELVIADLTGSNANAFYELALRHMAQRAIVHIAEYGMKMPFDVSAFRAVKYSLREPKDVEAAKAELSAQIRAIREDGYKVDNPVTRSRGLMKVEQNATPTERIVLSTVEEVQQRLAVLEARVEIATRAVGTVPPTYSGIGALGGMPVPYMPPLRSREPWTSQPGSAALNAPRAYSVFVLAEAIETALPAIVGLLRGKKVAYQEFRVSDTVGGKIEINFEVFAQSSNAVDEHVREMRKLPGVIRAQQRH